MSEKTVKSEKNNTKQHFGVKCALVFVVFSVCPQKSNVFLFQVQLCIQTITAQVI